MGRIEAWRESCVLLYKFTNGRIETSCKWAQVSVQQNPTLARNPARDRPIPLIFFLV